MELFLFGLFLGFSLICIIILWVIAWYHFYNNLRYGGLDPDDDELFKYIFPIFRGAGSFKFNSGLFIVYMWLLAWNVYVWNNHNINYKLILKFNHHYSQLNELLVRASVFTAVILILFIWFLIMRYNIAELGTVVGVIDQNYSPGIIWLLLLGIIKKFIIDYILLNK